MGADHVQSDPSKSPQRKVKPVVLYAKAFFPGKTGTWSSQLGWAEIIYVPDNDGGRIKLRKRWQQRAKGGSPEWVSPRFPRKSRSYFLRVAKRFYEEGYPKKKRVQSDNAVELKGHIPDLCKMCMTKGRPCNDKSHKGRISSGAA